MTEQLDRAKWEGQIEQQIADATRRLDNNNGDIRIIKEKLGVEATDKATIVEKLDSVAKNVEHNTAWTRTISVALLVSALGLIGSLLAGKL